MAGLAPKKYDCLIWGGYGHGNTGDEWCLAAALQRARQFGPAIAVLSPTPEYTAWLFPETTVDKGVNPLHCSFLLIASGGKGLGKWGHFAASIRANAR